MVHRLLLLLCLAVLAGCQTGPQTFNDVHTGKRGYYSSWVTAHADHESSVIAAAAYSQSSDIFAIFTEFRTSTGRYVYLDEAWSFGQEIPYKHQDRLKICGDGCVAIEMGRLDLSREAFETAAREGLEFRLVGRRADPVCKLPPEVFEQVLQWLRDGGFQDDPNGSKRRAELKTWGSPPSDHGHTHTLSTLRPMPVSSS